ncbi:hypothetical protein RB595_007217 [Gaeumannomyces hyphopodioides]
MAVPSDPPGGTVAFREARNDSEDGGLSDDDDLDLYSQDGTDPQANVSEAAAADGAAESAVAMDDYAKSFDSPIREEEEAEPPQDEAEPVVSAPSLERSSHEQPEPADPAPDQSPSNSSPLASEGSTGASPPSSSGAQPAGPSVAQPDVAVATVQPADGARAAQQHQSPKDPSQLASQPALRTESSDLPKAHYEESSFAGNDANLALDIQELVNDINGASPSVSAASLSSDSSASNAAGQMQLEPGSPPAVAVQTAGANVASATGLALPNAPSLPGGMPPPAINQQPSKPGEPNPLLFPTNVVPPTGPAALMNQGKKGSGGVNKGGRGAKNGNAQPPSGPAATRGAPSGPKAQSGSRHNARNAGQQTYDMFLADERRYTAEAKWEKFPDGSRIFVGNLSQERVSKKEVFNMFHKHGRLAQISLKPAYGFVQYHTAAEAAEAIRHLQGIDVRGRKINLEVSKTQKKSGKERERSPDRNNDRNKKGGRKGDAYDGRDNARDGGRHSDGYRPSYDQPARRGGDRLGDDHSRGRHGERGRSRSRSPRPYPRSDDYRQRSPTRAHGDSHEYGAYGGQSARASQGGIPDAQILLLQDVHKDFVQYVQKGFSDRDLRTDVMFVDPRFLDSIVQRQIVDGAHAVVKLDLHAQSVGKVAVQVFNRTPGTTQVNFNEYRDLDVSVAAELVLQTKMRSQPPVLHRPQPAAYPAPQATPGYPQAYAQPNYPAYALNAQAAAALVPGVDPALVQKVIMSLQGQQPQSGAMAPAAYSAPVHAPVPASAPPHPHPTAHHAMGGGAAPQQHFDINAILSNLKGSSAAPPMGAVSAPYGVPSYPATTAPGPMAPATHQHGADPNQQVQSIMAQLARFRQ